MLPTSISAGLFGYRATAVVPANTNAVESGQHQPTQEAGPVDSPSSLIRAPALIQHDPTQHPLRFDLNISRFIAHRLPRRCPPAFPAELYTHFPHGCFCFASSVGREAA